MKIEIVEPKQKKTVKDLERGDVINYCGEMFVRIKSGFLVQTANNEYPIMSLKTFYITRFVDGDTEIKYLGKLVATP